MFATTNPGSAGAGTYHLDKQYVDMGAFAGKTLLSVVVTDSGHSLFQRLLVSGITAVVPAGSVVAGQAQLEGCIVPLAQGLTFTFRPANGGAAFKRVAGLASDGTYSLSDIPHALYTVHIKGTRWLATNAALDTSNGDILDFNFQLPAGDADNNNVVDTADFNALIGAFGGYASDYQSGYDVTTDLNCDGLIDAADFALLTGNFGKQGAP